MPESQPIIKFDRYELDLRAGELRRNSWPVKLPNQAFRLLVAFLRHRGEVLTRDHLRAQIWPSDVFIDFDNGLNAAVGKLRVVLGKPPGSRSKSYIETIPRVGYRFIFPENAERAGQRFTSLAILPFTTNCNNSDLDCLCEGLTEALIEDISASRGVKKVIARNSVYRFKGRDPQEAGRELGVEAVVSGQVQPAGNNVIARAELLSAAEGLRLWGAQYQTHAHELPLLSSRIASALRDRMGWKLRSRSARSAPRRPTDMEAFRLYLRGRYFWAKRPTMGCVEKAIEMFSQAVALDPGFALAHVGLADCYNTLGGWEAGVMDPKLALERGKAAANRALQLDSNLAEAHTSLGYCHLHYDWDYARAEAEFRRAITLNSNYSHAHHWYSHLLVAMGRNQESLEHSLRIIELDPLDLVINSHLSWHYHMSGNFQTELEESRKLLDMEPNFHKAHYFMGLALEQLGSAREAIKAFERSYELSGSTVMLSALGHAYAAAGDHDRALRVLSNLAEIAKNRYVSSYELGIIYIALEDYEKALVCLEKAYAERSGWIPYLAVDPILAPLRSEARFQALLRSVCDWSKAAPGNGELAQIMSCATAVRESAIPGGSAFPFISSKTICDHGPPPAPNCFSSSKSTHPPGDKLKYQGKRIL